MPLIWYFFLAQFDMFRKLQVEDISVVVTSFYRAMQQTWEENNQFAKTAKEKKKHHKAIIPNTF